MAVSLFDIGFTGALERHRNSVRVAATPVEEHDVSINLDQVEMKAIQTAPNGVVNHETVFHFSQNGHVVTATYAGGKIRKGFLTGTLKSNQLSFTYCQLHTDDKLDHGRSKCQVTTSARGLIRVIEHFEWGSREGEVGVNVFEQVIGSLKTSENSI